MGFFVPDHANPRLFGSSLVLAWQHVEIALAVEVHQLDPIILDALGGR
ncbi:MAG: hypothetical protein M3463_13775 [Verrucomicrobiota bacterium]|nr:hypothetical protein [Verrucomicrobiota bacterium]